MSDRRINCEKLNQGTILVNPEQTLDNNNAHEMIEILSKAAEDKIKHVIIDMEWLEFISSAGVGSILGMIESFREVGGDIILCNVPDNIMHVFDVLDLRDFLTIKSNKQTAAADCGIA